MSKTPPRTAPPRSLRGRWQDWRFARYLIREWRAGRIIITYKD